jgi:hypothetical protein
VDSAAGSAGLQSLQGMILHMNWSYIGAVKTVSPWASQPDRRYGFIHSDKLYTAEPISIHYRNRQIPKMKKADHC